jgi:hypothetical protein
VRSALRASGAGGIGRRGLQLAAACCAFAGAPAIAQAAEPQRAATPGQDGKHRGIEIGFADPMFLSKDAELRGQVFNAALQAGAGFARVPVGWGSVAKRAPFDPTDPGDPAYDWSQLDRAVNGAGGRGKKVLMTIHRAPERAEAPGRPVRLRAPAGTWKPNPEALGQFAAALARRYDGTYVPRFALRPLPRAEFFEPWNEPNLSGFLTPQWDGHRQVSAHTYRDLLNAGYAGVKASQPDATVIAGATGPGGDAPGGRRTGPLRFLRDLLCLRRGRDPKPKACPAPARFDVLSHHPITPSQSPRLPVEPGNAGFQEMPEIRKLLRTAERHGTVRPAGLRRDLWATELWWETAPSIRRADYGAPGERRQARYLADALRILWRQRVPVALLFQVRDDPDVALGPRTGWGSGLQFADGTPKLAFGAVRFPFVADRVGRKRVMIWTRAPAAGRLRITARKPKRKTRTLIQARVAAGDVVSRRVRYRGWGHLRARLDGAPSMTWRVPKRP